jgi:hypothetical protein
MDIHFGSPPRVPVDLAAAQSSRERVALRFRAGDRDAALADLQQQLSAGGTDPALVPDLITLLQQAGHLMYPRIWCET